MVSSVLNRFTGGFPACSASDFLSPSAQGPRESRIRTCRWPRARSGPGMWLGFVEDEALHALDRLKVSCGDPWAGAVGGAGGNLAAEVDGEVFPRGTNRHHRQHRAATQSPRWPPGPPSAGTTDRTARSHVPDGGSDPPGPRADTTAAARPRGPAAPTTNAPTRSAPRTPSPAPVGSPPTTPGVAARSTTDPGDSR